MKIITKQSLIDTVPERWFKAYYLKNPKNNFKTTGGFSLDIYNNLMKNLPLTDKKIKKIIGNDSWHRNDCNECGKDQEVIIEIGNPDFGALKLCKDCLLKAHTLIIANKD